MPFNPNRLLRGWDAIEFANRHGRTLWIGHYDQKRPIDYQAAVEHARGGGSTDIWITKKKTGRPQKSTHQKHKTIAQVCLTARELPQIQRWCVDVGQVHANGEPNLSGGLRLALQTVGALGVKGVTAQHLQTLADAARRREKDVHLHAQDDPEEGHQGDD